MHMIYLPLLLALMFLDWLFPGEETLRAREEAKIKSWEIGASSASSGKTRDIRFLRTERESFSMSRNSMSRSSFKKREVSRVDPYALGARESVSSLWTSAFTPASDSLLFSMKHNARLGLIETGIKHDRRENKVNRSWQFPWEPRTKTWIFSVGNTAIFNYEDGRETREIIAIDRKKRIITFSEPLPENGIVTEETKGISTFLRVGDTLILNFIIGQYGKRDKRETCKFKIKAIDRKSGEVSLS